MFKAVQQIGMTGPRFQAPAADTEAKKNTDARDPMEVAAPVNEAQEENAPGVPLALAYPVYSRPWQEKAGVSKMGAAENPPAQTHAGNMQGAKRARDSEEELDSSVSTKRWASGVMPTTRQAAAATDPATTAAERNSRSLRVSSPGLRTADMFPVQAQARTSVIVFPADNRGRQAPRPGLALAGSMPVSQGIKPPSDGGLRLSSRTWELLERELGGGRLIIHGLPEISCTPLSAPASPAERTTLYFDRNDAPACHGFVAELKRWDRTLAYAFDLRNRRLLPGAAYMPKADALVTLLQGVATAKQFGLLGLPDHAQATDLEVLALSEIINPSLRETGLARGHEANPAPPAAPEENSPELLSVSTLEATSPAPIQSAGSKRSLEESDNAHETVVANSPKRAHSGQVPQAVAAAELSAAEMHRANLAEAERFGHELLRASTNFLNGGVHGEGIRHTLVILGLHAIPLPPDDDSPHCVRITFSQPREDANVHVKIEVINRAKDAVAAPRGYTTFEGIYEMPKTMLGEEGLYSSILPLSLLTAKGMLDFPTQKPHTRSFKTMTKARTALRVAIDPNMSQRELVRKLYSHKPIVETSPAGALPRRDETSAAPVLFDKIVAATRKILNRNLTDCALTIGGLRGGKNASPPNDEPYFHFEFRNEDGLNKVHIQVARAGEQPWISSERTFYPVNKMEEGTTGALLVPWAAGITEYLLVGKDLPDDTRAYVRAKDWRKQITDAPEWKALGKLNLRVAFANYIPVETASASRAAGSSQTASVGGLASLADGSAQEGSAGKRRARITGVAAVTRTRARKAPRAAGGQPVIKEVSLRDKSRKQ